ncbi:HAD-IA family hydrolase [Patescibacteria group bacterium]|nr:HAD-IA family hydrolase [Patescibacteria group bacterium]
MKKAILFDIDGTILDTRDFVFNALRHSLTTHGYPYPTEKNIKKATGSPLTEFYKVLMPGADVSVFVKAHVEFQENNFRTIKIFPKAEETLKSLKNDGFFLAAVSNRTRKSLLRLLQYAGVHDCFDAVVSPDDVTNPKPHQEHLLFALKKLKVKPENSYMVGDMAQDILAGRNAKVKTVGVTYGFLGQDIAKYGPDYLIDNIEDLLKILRSANI